MAKTKVIYILKEMPIEDIEDADEFDEECSCPYFCDEFSKENFEEEDGEEYD